MIFRKRYVPGLIFAFMAAVFLLDMDCSKAQARDEWYEDAPYFHLKARYEELLSSAPQGTETLREEYELALFLCGQEFPGWTNPFDKKAVKGKDQFEKGVRLLEHIVQCYPTNEYLVLAAKAQLAGQHLNMGRDAVSVAKTYVQIFAIPVEDVVDSTVPGRNQVMVEAASSNHAAENRQITAFSRAVEQPFAPIARTPAQKDFEDIIKKPLRARVIELCKGIRPVEAIFLLNEIEARCASTDTELKRMAGEAAMEAVARELKEMELNTATKGTSK